MTEMCWVLWHVEGASALTTRGQGGRRVDWPRDVPSILMSGAVILCSARYSSTACAVQQPFDPTIID